MSSPSPLRVGLSLFGSLRFRYFESHYGMIKPSPPYRSKNIGTQMRADCIVPRIHHVMLGKNIYKSGAICRSNDKMCVIVLEICEICEICTKK